MKPEPSPELIAWADRSWEGANFTCDPVGFLARAVSALLAERDAEIARKDCQMNGLKMCLGERDKFMVDQGIPHALIDQLSARRPR